MVVSLAMRWLLIAALSWLLVVPSLGRDVDGKYAQSNPELHDWFMGLRSKGNAPCCADADGTPDPDWVGKKGPDGLWHYQVRLGGKWVDVPDDAVVDGPNRAGRTIVWTYTLYGEVYVRCFMPGSMS